MELFFGSHNEEIGEWIPIEEKMPSFPGGVGKVAVKINDCDSTHAFLCEDMGAWSCPMLRPSYFWDCKSHDPIRNVTHFKYLKAYQNDDHGDDQNDRLFEEKK